MDPHVKQLIEQVHAAPFKAVLALTGGGVSAAANLLAVPGGSRTLLEIIVPYDERALSQFLGSQPEQFCSAAATRQLARRAYERACWIDARSAATAHVGVGCTASLVSDRPKRGQHRLHVSWQNADRGVSYSVVLNKGERDREGEERLVSAVVLNALAEAFNISDTVDLDLHDGEELQMNEEAVPLLAEFFSGKLPSLLVNPDGQLAAGASVQPAVLLPGSFNPLHPGHMGLQAVAQRLLGRPAAFELSIVNADKPQLDIEEVRRRIAQFAWRAPLWLTRAPTFVEKARLFPGVVFVVGTDTAERIVAPRYYAGVEAGMLQALAEIEKLGCRFVVAGRVAADGRFHTLADLPIPERFCGLFRAIARADFAANISSTELRMKM